MRTLLDYTHTEFPNHTVEVWQRDGWSMPIRDDEPEPDGPHDGGGSDTSGSVGPGRDDAGRGAGREGGDIEDVRRGGPPVTGTHASAEARQPASGPADDAPHRRRADESVPSLALRDHTVVAHVIGAQATLELMERLRSAGWPNTTAVLVCPAQPSVFPHGDEDPESVVDLPRRRLIGAAALGAVVGFLLGAIGGWVVGDDVLTGIVTGGFVAVLGAVAGAMLGGLGRHAGERAWSQPNVPGRTMGVVATFADDETAARRVVRTMEGADPYDIRIVTASGSWRTPLG